MTHEDAFRTHSTSATGYLVGTGAAVGAEMILSGDLKQSGFFIPEMLPVGKYLDKLRAKGLEIHQKSTAM
jgi:saccharopine dehydrogenase-like NADP-dependent oxidoreductase